MSDKVEKQEEQLTKVRITLSSPSVKRIERVAEDIKTRSLKQNLEPRGPVRLPTKVLKVTTRKSPNGEGSKTYDTYEMRIHKRIILVDSPAPLVMRIAGTAVDPKVHITMTIAQPDDE